MDVQNRLWAGLGARAARNEVALFPGFLPPLLMLAAFLLAGQRQARRLSLFCLDVSFWLACLLTLLAIGYGNPAWPWTLALAVLLLLIRLALARPVSWGMRYLRRWRKEVYAHGMLWASLGFAGSFGLNFIFHRFLFEYVPLFRSMRVAARWSMICYLGLALLAGVGASRCAAWGRRHAPRLGRVWGYALILLLVLFEQRTAPLAIVRGAAQPDVLTLRLKDTPMSGGILELPLGEYHNLRYMLRAADHEKPLVNAISSFVPPELYAIEDATRQREIPDSLFGVLEQVPVSYLTVRYAYMTPALRLRFGQWLERGVNSGRLRFINHFPEFTGVADVPSLLYAVTKNEPAALSEATPPPYISTQDFAPYFAALPPEYGAEAFALARLYRVAYGRAVTLEEMKAAQNQAKAEAITAQKAFLDRYGDQANEGFVNALCANAKLDLATPERSELAQQLDDGKITRAAVLQAIAGKATVYFDSFDETFVLFHYFAYLDRDPEPGGLAYWSAGLASTLSPAQLHRTFLAAPEYQEKLNRRK